jgi:hypothetical protein
MYGTLVAFSIPIKHNVNLYGFSNNKRVIEKPEDFKRGDDIEKGIVKWLVEMIDETGEITGVATILTMVARKENR